MKKFLKILGIVILIIIVGILGYTYISFNSYSPGKVEYEVDQSKMKYFEDSYESCRESFINSADMCCERFFKVEIFSKAVPSGVDSTLKIDFCYVPAQKESKKLLILTSGVHGIEGFVGSAVQQMIIDQYLKTGMPDDLGVLFIHGINPYGFKYTRRVTENNIDFNRNCDTEMTLFSSENAGYTDLYDMLNPKGKVISGSLKNKFFMLVAINKLMQESMSALRQAVLQGQYEYPEGLYYGGNNFEPQLSIIGEVISEKSADYDTILNIDLHTGYGARGVLHLFPNPVEDLNVKQKMEEIFTGYQIDWGDSDDFYTINGSFSDYIGKLIPDKFYLPMTFEYGTLNSQTTIGSVKSIHNMILENEGKRFGYQSERDSLKVLENFVEMYYPTSEPWRSKIMNDTYIIMEQLFDRF
ncbi:MAG: DUF2817 domain-containing protein [Prolixibacteraceae bacterium]|nr:DUF2817 domain-containing protein [Prolixibacteraceae bacterium]MBN2774550.1 DUF2817 domain-containing protein [Prolixibacteraceae bacterium]